MDTFVHNVVNVILCEISLHKAYIGFHEKVYLCLKLHFEQPAVMNANKSTTITQYTTENLNQRKIAIG